MSKGNPYREPGVIEFERGRTFALHKFDKGGRCPKCDTDYPMLGDICEGKTSLLGTVKCPKVTHFHTECRHCKYKSMMATKDVLAGEYL